MAGVIAALTSVVVFLSAILLRARKRRAASLGGHSGAHRVPITPMAACDSASQREERWRIPWCPRPRLAPVAPSPATAAHAAPAATIPSCAATISSSPTVAAAPPPPPARRPPLGLRAPPRHAVSVPATPSTMSHFTAASGGNDSRAPERGRVRARPARPLRAGVDTDVPAPAPSALGVEASARLAALESDLCRLEERLRGYGSRLLPAGDYEDGPWKGAEEEEERAWERPDREAWSGAAAALKAQVGMLTVCLEDGERETAERPPLPVVPVEAQ